MILGIEIGGTKLQLGVGDPNQRSLVELKRFDVDRSRGARGILDQILSAAPTLIEQFHIKKIGIGYGGPVDTVSKKVITSHHIDGWDGFELGRWCVEKLGCEASIDNDCNVAALAEANRGAGEGFHRVFYVTVGTGIGGGLVIDGRIDGTGRPAIAEIGHLRPGPNAKLDSETVEAFSSGSGIEKQMRTHLATASESQGDRDELMTLCDSDLSNLTAKRIGEAFLNGNSHATTVMSQAISTLGWGIAQVITLIAPDVVVIGGGVSLIGDRFFSLLNEAIEIYVFPPLRDSFRVVPAALGEEVVLHGAILL